MGHGPHKVGLNRLLFRLHQYMLLLLKLDILLGKHNADTAGKAGDKGHSNKGDGIALQGEVK